MTVPIQLAGRRIHDRLRDTPALHLADQVLSSGTNFLGVIAVARLASPQEFGVFSIFLITCFLTGGFNRGVPHAVAMTVEWDDERARNGFFFLPPLVLGSVAALVLVPAFAILDPSFLLLPVLLVPMLVQDAVRMHAFALQRPVVALVSDAVWLAVAAVGFLVTTTATSAATFWAVGGLAGLLVTRPWRIRVRFRRRPTRPRRPHGTDLAGAALEYGAVAGIAYLSPLLATPIIALAGVGALQGVNVIRGPIQLLVQGLVAHRMSGPPISPSTCTREAARLSVTVLAATMAAFLPLFVLRGTYGPPLLGSSWPAIEPLVLPALLAQAVACAAFGPLTVMRKMGRFPLAALVQLALIPFYLGLPLAGAALGGAGGFLYATALAWAVAGALWWIVLSRVAAGAVASADAAVA